MGCRASPFLDLKTSVQLCGVPETTTAYLLLAADAPPKTPEVSERSFDMSAVASPAISWPCTCQRRSIVRGKYLADRPEILALPQAVPHQQQLTGAPMECYERPPSDNA
jgi:hypothetical protein